MNAFYNKLGIGDTLIINVKMTEGDSSYETFGDVVKIFDEATKEVVGYNIFNASTYGDIGGQGAVEITEDMKELIQQAFARNGIEAEVDLEQRPAFVVGYVEAKESHPNADKLSICQVNVGTEVLQIVCGAPNIEAGQRVVVALIGAVMPSGLVIKQAALRGIESFGMICSAKELALPNAPEEKGILVLDPSYDIGSEFKSM